MGNSFPALGCSQIVGSKWGHEESGAPAQTPLSGYQPCALERKEPRPSYWLIVTQPSHGPTAWT